MVEDAIFFVVPLSAPKTDASYEPRDLLLRPLPPRSSTDHRAVFGFGQGTTAQTIKDGLGSTMAVVEHLRGVSERDGRGAFWSNDDSMQMIQATNGPISTVSDRLRQRRVESSTFLANDWGCFGVSGVAVASPNNRPPLNLPCASGASANTRQNGIDGVASARSRHQTGVNVLFCDGRVAFIDDAIDSSAVAPYGTWQRLAWTDDGLPVSPP